MNRMQHIPAHIGCMRHCCIPSPAETREGMALTAADGVASAVLHFHALAWSEKNPSTDLFCQGQVDRQIVLSTYYSPAAHSLKPLTQISRQASEYIFNQRLCIRNGGMALRTGITCTGYFIFVAFTGKTTIVTLWHGQFFTFNIFPVD